MCCGAMGEGVCSRRFWPSVLLESCSVAGKLPKRRLERV